MLKVITILCLLLHSSLSQEDAHEDECLNPIDLIIVLDGSFSVTQNNFDVVKNWVKQLVAGLHIDHGHTQVGVVQYSHYYKAKSWNQQRYIKTEIQLGQYQAQESFEAAVDRIRYQGYKTYTAHALNKTLNIDFVGANNRYPEAKRALILLTDGRATDWMDLPPIVERAELEMGVVMYAVGVGDYSSQELRLIAHNHTERVFELAKFKDLKHIVSDLLAQLQKVCDCNVLGSKTETCDACTQQCDCKPNVMGRRCEDCDFGSYGFGNTEGCSLCQCNPFGSSDPYDCDSTTGQCECLTEIFAGRDCGACAEGFFNFPDCRLCECNGFSTVCDQETGVCEACTKGRRGDHCEICPAGNYLDQEVDDCLPCPCNGNINASDPEACDPISGTCLECLYNTDGERCEKCREYFYGDALIQSCKKCECNSDGTRLSSCDNGECICDEMGACSCLSNVEGKSCDRCVAGAWQLISGRGCIKCECNEVGTRPNTTCNENNGECVCNERYTGTNCNDCAEGFTRDSFDDGCVLFSTVTEKPEDLLELGGDLPIIINGELTRDREPTPPPDETTTSIARTTTIRTTTPRKPLPVNPGWSPCVGCGGSGSVSWPSYCHGWMCRKRWPYHQQVPSSRRCYSAHWGCRAAVKYNQYGNYYNQGNSDYYGGGYGYGWNRPSYYRGYYHHTRTYRRPTYYEPLARYSLYKTISKKKR